MSWASWLQVARARRASSSRRRGCSARTSRGCSATGRRPATASSSPSSASSTASSASTPRASSAGRSTRSRCSRSAPSPSLGLFLLQRAPGRALPESDRRRGRPAGARVQHRGELRHEHELAELRRRVDDEPPDADVRARGAELRLGCGRHRRRGRAHPRARRAAARRRSATSGSTSTRVDDPRAPAARRRRSRSCSSARASSRTSRGFTDAHDRRGRDAVDPRRADREPGGDQGARHERRRPVQRELGAPVREPERLHEPRSRCGRCSRSPSR